MHNEVQLYNLSVKRKEKKEKKNSSKLQKCQGRLDKLSEGERGGVENGWKYKTGVHGEVGGLFTETDNKQFSLLLSGKSMKDLQTLL